MDWRSARAAKQIDDVQVRQDGKPGLHIRNPSVDLGRVIGSARHERIHPFDGAADHDRADHNQKEADHDVDQDDNGRLGQPPAKYVRAPWVCGAVHERSHSGGHDHGREHLDDDELELQQQEGERDHGDAEDRRSIQDARRGQLIRAGSHFGAGETHGSAQASNTSCSGPAQVARSTYRQLRPIVRMRCGRIFRMRRCWPGRKRIRVGAEIFARHLVDVLVRTVGGCLHDRAADTGDAKRFRRIVHVDRHAGITAHVPDFLVRRDGIDDDVRAVGVDPDRVSCGDPSGMSVAICA